MYDESDECDMMIFDPIRSQQSRTVWHGRAHDEQVTQIQHTTCDHALTLTFDHDRQILIGLVVHMANITDVNNT